MEPHAEHAAETMTCASDPVLSVVMFILFLFVVGYRSIDTYKSVVNNPDWPKRPKKKQNRE